MTTYETYDHGFFVHYFEGTTPFLPFLPLDEQWRRRHPQRRLFRRDLADLEAAAVVEWWSRALGRAVDSRVSATDWQIVLHWRLRVFSSEVQLLLMEMKFLSKLQKENIRNH